MAPLHLRFASHRTSITANILLLALCFLSGCATPSRIAPPTARAPESAPPEAIIAWSQDEIAATINSSNIATATGGGLIFALIDAGINSARAKKAESAIVPLRDALIAYDGGAALARELEASLSAGQPGGSAAEVRVKSFADRKVLASWVKESDAEEVLLVQPKYELTPGFDAMTFTVIVSLHAQKASGTAATLKRPQVPPGPRYYNTFIARIPNPQPATSASREDAIAAWTTNDAEPARQTLDRGFATIARMIAHDLAQPGPTQTLYQAPAEAESYIVPLVPSAPLVGGRGYVEKEDDHHKWVRLPTGELYAVSK